LKFQVNQFSNIIQS